MELHPLDFQIQTTVSDGKHTPEACVEMAQADGVTTIAITDHDTVAGVERAVRHGAALGVEVIPGIEISVEDYHIHMLGLGVNHEHQPLLGAIARFGELRLARAKEMVQRFTAGGFAIDWEDVLRESKGASVIASPQIVEAILKRPENKERLGGITRKADFFKKFLQEGSRFYVHHTNISAEGATQLIHAAGGIAVWSHPPVPSFPESCRDLELFLEKLVAWGLDGVEVFSPSHTESNTACLVRLSKQYHLIQTGGSDFHEWGEASGSSWPRSAIRIGEFPTYGHSIEKMAEGVREAMRARKEMR